MRAGRAGACLHIMSVLQAYQADLLKELDEREQVSSDDIAELRRTAGLSLRATKATARAIGRSMAAMVAAERHLWLTLSDMKASGGVPAVPPSPLSGSEGCWAEQPSTSTGSSYREAQKESAASRAPPRRGQKQRYSSGASKSKPVLGLRLGGPRRKSPDTWGCRTSEGRPLWGRKELQVAYLSPVPSTLRSVRRKGTETHVTPEGVYKTDSSGPTWRCAVTGVRATVSTPEASLERLVPLVDYLAAWYCQMCLNGSCRL